MLYRFIVLNGPGKGEQSTLPVDELVIGRDENCGLRLDDPEAAAQHARVTPTPQGPKISDLGSMNRILVNKREVREATLRHGDVVEIGRTQLLLQAHLQAEVIEDSAPSLRRATRGSIRAAAWAVILLGVWTVYRIYAPSATPNPRATEPAAESSPTLPAPEPEALPAAPESNEVSVELRQLREELAEVKSAVRGLAGPSAPPASAGAPEPESRGPDPDPASERASASERELADARRRIESGDREGAHERLEQLQMEDPGFLPAYAERARLFELQGELQRAIGQWALMIQRSQGGAMAGKAAEEWARLASSQATGSPAVPIQTGPFPATEPESVPLPPAESAPTPAPPSVRFVNLSQRRFPESPDYDEMRVIRADIACAGARPPDPMSLRLEITFFDRMRDTGPAYPTRVMPSTYELGSAGVAWTPQGEMTLSAAYVVPRGRRPAGAPEQFYGYVARLYCNGQVEDVEARPLDLLRHPHPTGAHAAVPAPVSAEPPAPPDLPEPAS